MSVTGGIMAATGLIGAGLSAHAAGHAASTQAAAANEAAQLQHQDAQEALQFQEQQYRNSLGLIRPYYTTGTQSLGTLASLMGETPQAANTSVFDNPFGNTAPSSTSGGFDGGFDGFDVGGDGGRIPMAARDRIAALRSGGALDGGNFLAKPNLGMGPDARLTFPNDTTGAPVAMNGNPGMLSVPSAGATAGGLPPGYLTQPFNEEFKAPDSLTEQNDPGFQARLKLGEQALANSAAGRGDLLTGGTAAAANQFAQDYASNEYSNVYNRALQNYQTRFNVFNQNRANIFNRYASLAGLGQTSTNELVNAGLSTGSGISNTLLTSGAQIGQQLNNAAAARASGYVGGANAISGGISGLSNLAMLYAILRQGGGAPAPSDTGV